MSSPSEHLVSEKLLDCSGSACYQRGITLDVNGELRVPVIHTAHLHTTDARTGSLTPKRACRAGTKLTCVITGEIKSQIDKVWNTFWSGGISNPLVRYEQRMGWVLSHLTRAKMDRPSRQGPLLHHRYWLTMAPGPSRGDQLQPGPCDFCSVLAQDRALRPRRTAGNHRAGTGGRGGACRTN